MDQSWIYTLPDHTCVKLKQRFIKFNYKLEKDTIPKLDKWLTVLQIRMVPLEYKLSLIRFLLSKLQNSQEPQTKSV